MSNGNIKVIGFTDKEDLITKIDAEVERLGFKKLSPEELKKRKKTKFVLQVAIESDVELMDLKELIAKTLRPLSDSGTFKKLTYGTLVEYEKVEFAGPYVKGTNNGSGCNFWIEKGNPRSD